MATSGYDAAIPATHLIEDTTEATGRGVILIRRLVRINMGLVALQPLSAGLFLSGYERAVTVHSGVAAALLLGALVQLITASLMWRRRRVPAWIGGVSIGLFVIVLAQMALGINKLYWLHVPVGVGMFGWLTRLSIKLDAPSPVSGAQS